jgi:hypothetical protein
VTNGNEDGWTHGNGDGQTRRGSRLTHAWVLGLAGVLNPDLPENQDDPLQTHLKTAVTCFKSVYNALKLIFNASKLVFGFQN